MSSPTRSPTAADRHSIWLVRHAPTEWTGRRWCGRSDPELSEEGREAAYRLADEIAAEIEVGQGAGVVVLSSPLRRALETAAAIGRDLDAPVQVEPDLVEVDFGAADGMTWDELVAAHPSLAETILDGGQPDWPEGETADQVAARAGSAAARIVDLAGSRVVVVVTHGGLLVALALHLGADIQAGSLGAAAAHRFDPVLTA